MFWTSRCELGAIGTSDRDTLPAVIKISSEGYRMFKAMCLEEGKSDSLSTQKKDLPFSNYPQAFLLSVSIGIVNDERLGMDGEKHWLIRSEYINPYFDV